MAEVCESIFISPHANDALTFTTLKYLSGQFSGSKSLWVSTEVGGDCATQAAKLKDEWGGSIQEVGRWDGDEGGSEQGISWTCQRFLETLLFSSMTEYRIVVLPFNVLSYSLLCINSATKFTAPIALLRTNNHYHTGSILRTFQSSKDFNDCYTSKSLKETRSDLYSSSFLSFSLFGSEEIREKSLNQSQVTGAKVKEIEIGGKGEGWFEAKIPEKGEALREILRETNDLSKKNREKQIKFAQIREELIRAIEEEFAHNWADAIWKVTEETVRLEEIKTALSIGIQSIKGFFVSISQRQTDFNRTIAGFAERNSAVFSQIREKVTAVEIETAEERETLRRLVSVVKEPIFTIQGVEKEEPDMKLVASVTRRKQYGVQSELLIHWEGGAERIIQMTSNSYPSKLDLGPIDQFPSDRIIHLLIRNPNDHRALSNSLSVDIHATISIPNRHRPVTYQDTLLYKLLGNIEEIELRIKEKAGDEGLETLRNLAMTWKNADLSKMDQFIEIVLNNVTQGAEQVKASLAAVGFNFS